MKLFKTDLLEAYRKKYGILVDHAYRELGFFKNYIEDYVDFLDDEPTYTECKVSLDPILQCLIEVFDSFIRLKESLPTIDTKTLATTIVYSCNRLIQLKPLTALTGEESEWATENDCNIRLNKRYYRVTQNTRTEESTFYPEDDPDNGLPIEFPFFVP